MDGLPDLSFIPQVRDATLAEIKRQNQATLDEAEALGITGRVLERLRRQGEQTLEQVQREHDLKWAWPN
jgi:hypothetical protein